MRVAPKGKRSFLAAVAALVAAPLLWLTLIVAPARADTIQYVYDALGRLAAAIDPSGETTLYTYDAAGNLLSVTRRSSSQVSIISFAPDHGKAGDSVTIFGSGFVPNAAQNAVAFNGVPAAVGAATATSLAATVPAGASSGPITVSNTNGSATSVNAFTIVAAPVITAVNPSIVAQGLTTRVEIGGSNLAFATSVAFTQAGMTASVLPGATNLLLPINLTVGSSVPPGAYGFSVTNATGTTSSGSVAVNVGVRPTGDAMTVSRPLSVFLPQAQAAPAAGEAMSVSRAVSVFLPPEAQAAPPAGESMSVTRAVSVSMP